MPYGPSSSSSSSGSASFGTLAGVPGDNAALVAALAAKLDKAGGTITGNGAASTPALRLNGSVFTGGSSTTTKPQLLVEPSGATSTGWSTSGTLIGANAASGFAGNLLDVQVNGQTRGSINSDGRLTLASGALTYDVSPYSVFGLKFSGVTAATMAIVTRDGNAVYFGRDTSIGWTTSSTDATAHIYGASFIAAQIFNRTSTPEGSQAAAPGSMALVNDGGTGKIFLKTSGTGNTGWTQITVP